MTAALEGGWVVSSTPRPHFTPGKEPVPILQEAGWAPGPVWTGGKSRPHRDSIPDLSARSRSLYWLSYRAHVGSTYTTKKNGLLRRSEVEQSKLYQKVKQLECSFLISWISQENCSLNYKICIPVYCFTCQPEAFRNNTCPLTSFHSSEATFNLRISYLKLKIA